MTPARDPRNRCLRAPGLLPAGGILIALIALAPPASAAEAADPAAGQSGSTASTGRLAGTVEVGSELSTRRIRFSLYPGPVAAPEASSGPKGDTAETANVVVYLESVPGVAAAAGVDGPPPAMRQEGLSFVPHVLAVVKGSEVAFPNGDPIFHNVFSLSRGAPFDLGRYPQGSSRSFRFDRPGLVKVFCHLHADMNGVILVLDNPFFASPDAEGRYGIEGIPPGEYAVVAWHERARPIRTTVRIEAGRTSVLDFGIPIGRATGE